MVISFGWKASLVTGFNVNYKYGSADPADSPSVYVRPCRLALLPAALAFDLVGGSTVLGHAAVLLCLLKSF